MRTAGIILSACLLYMASAGLRTVFGVLLNVIAAGTGIAYAQVSSAIAFSVYGAAVMLGCLICGFLCNKFSMKNVLSAVFGSRVIWPVIFIFMPKNEVTIMVIVILLGLTGAAFRIKER